MSDQNFDALSEYERKEFDKLQRHKQKDLARSPKQLVPQKVRVAASRRVQQLKGKIDEPEEQGRWLGRVNRSFTAGAEGLAKMVTRVAHTTLSQDRVVKAYKRHGVDSLSDIQAVDLRVIDATRPKRFDFFYAGVAALEGMASGAIIAGGEALAVGGGVAGAGVGGVPGFGAIAATMGTDAGFLIAASSRAVAHTAMYYGFDPDDPAEQVFAMSVISLGTAGGTAAKTIAYQELSQLTQQLARRATWKVLDSHLIAKAAKVFAARMGVKLTQRKLGQVVPVVGIGIGGGLNYLLLDRVCSAAHWAYRERFLVDKMGGSSGFSLSADPQPGSSADDAEGEYEEPISVFNIIDEASSGDDET